MDCGFLAICRMFLVALVPVSTYGHVIVERTWRKQTAFGSVHVRGVILNLNEGRSNKLDTGRLHDTCSAIREFF